MYDTLYKEYVELSRLSANEGLFDIITLVQEKICWISKVIMKYRRDFKEVSNVNSDLKYIQQRSELLHEKYKAKEEEFKVDVD
jgi:hypothetical protein